MTMESSDKMMTTIPPPLHTQTLLRRASFNHLFAVVYAVTILLLIYHHLRTLLNPSSFIFTLLLLLSDLILAFNWFCTQSFRFRPIRRREFVENFEKILHDEELELPAVDIFICTADPYKEPPMGTVNTALSVMAYDYPPEKVSVYVSDDGGSQFTLFAFMEAAKFARHWLPFCRDNNVMVRCPEAYFGGNLDIIDGFPEANRIKILYECMKVRVENALERGKIEDDIIDDDELRQVLSKWTLKFTPQNHPTVIQVLLASSKDKDNIGQVMPNLIYVSREKSISHDHLFKAGALNALIRVSATMTNAPIVLTLDCDSYSNDPQTIKRTMCYLSDPKIGSKLAYVQFPQIFRGLNKGDIYHCEYKQTFQINPMGMDGLQGPDNFGTGGFFQRRAFFGSPSCFIQPEIVQLSPKNLVKESISSTRIHDLAYQVAACDYEDQTNWGIKLGFRYGSLVEDYYTGFRMQCEGWKSIFCYPERPAFLGDSPITLIDLLRQYKRWINGLLDVLFSKHSTVTFGVQQLGLLMGLSYSHYAFSPILCIPIALYAFFPQIALLNGISMFPKVSEPWFYLYIFIFVAANAKDLIDFLLEKGTIERWWNYQRMWMIYGLSCYLFGCIEYALSSLGIAVRGFDVTNKVEDEELRKRYNEGTFEFGVASPMFVPMTMASLLNLAAFLVGLFGIFTKGFTSMEGLILQIILSGFVVINCWPIYEAMMFRSDMGKLPLKTTMISTFLGSILYVVASIHFGTVY